MKRKNFWRGLASSGVVLGAIALVLSSSTSVEAKIFGRRGCFFQQNVSCRVQPTIGPFGCCDATDSGADFSGWGTPDFYVQKGFKVPLFNGVDLTGWTDVKGGTPGEGWKVVDGAIYREKNAGDLYAVGKFDNFILEFEFKVDDKGNSGIKYKSWNTDGFGLGCEYQIYDDISDVNNPPYYQTASLYAVKPPREGTAKIKMGEFNRGKIVVAGNHIEHYLNGELIMSINVGSAEWNELVAKSKFKDMKEFGTTTLGRIFLQDHNCRVWFKNITITKLTPAYRVGICGRYYVY